MGTYAKAFEIPDGFPAILREFAKEAIREQPEDIYRLAKITLTRSMIVTIHGGNNR